MSPLELLVCLLLILTSAFLSSSEIALFSLSRFQLRFLRDHVQAGTFRNIKRLTQDPGGLLVTILVLNEIVNIGLSSLVTKSIALQSGQPLDSGHWVSDLLRGTGITTLIILFACEITPKVVGAKANQLISTLSSRPLSFIYEAMKPVRWLLKSLVSFTSQKLKDDPNGEGSAKGAKLKESEFLLMVEEGHKEGAIHQSELELIQNVFEFDDSRVESILTPLNQVHTVSQDTTVKSALSTRRSRRFSRIPITTPNKRQIVGILYTKDLLRAKLEQGMMNHPVSELMRKPLFVHPSMQLNALFRKFKQHRMHMAVVQKPSGETLGVVTMDDVLDSLFGDLLPDEEDKE
ncbi:MAG: hemolysin family protein [Bdellovibrionia bacterium]